MKYLHKINLMIFFSIILLFSGCTDLTETPEDELAEESIDFTSESDVESLMGYVYVELRNLYWGWNGYFDIMEESSDLIMTPYRIGVGWGDLYINMHTHEFTSNLDHFWTIWYYGYVGVSYCNMLLDMDAIQENSLNSARIRAMRALYYYILFDCFRNIPLETTLDVPSGYLPTQAEPQEVYDFIIDELTEVKEDLGTDNVYGYLNQYGADMILAKMYLNHNAWFGTDDDDDYTNALAQVNDVINNGGYSLADNYSDCFAADLSDNQEIIFALPFEYSYATGNYLVNKCLIGAGADAYGYTGTPWNGSCAIPQFINTYDANDKRLDDTWAHGQQYDYDSGEALTVDADDQGTVNLVYTKEVHSIDNPGAYNLEGYRFVKNEIVAGSEGTYGDDVPFFRLSDAYFIKAECLLRLGQDEQTAADLITAVRERSFENESDATRTIADLTGGSVYDYGHREYTNEDPTNYSTGYEYTEEGGDDIEFGGLLDDLAWEFVGEHHRRQDLIRFKMTSGDYNVYNGKSWFCKDADFDSNKDIFPIYQDFLDSNTNLEQNTGY